jgi:hypothetical protein
MRHAVFFESQECLLASHMEHSRNQRKAPWEEWFRQPGRHILQSCNGRWCRQTLKRSWRWGCPTQAVSPWLSYMHTHTLAQKSIMLQEYSLALWWCLASSFFHSGNPDQSRIFWSATAFRRTPLLHPTLWYNSAKHHEIWKASRHQHE